MDKGNGYINITGVDGVTSDSYRAFGVYKGSNERISFNYSGSAVFAGGACGFTSTGELFFTSRGTRYKLFVSQGLVQAEEYTRQMELKEKGEQFVADNRETKPSTQAEVSMDNDNA